MKNLLLLLLCLTLLSFSSCAEQKITSEERDLLAKLVYLEAGTCGQECQRAIVSVVFNQLEAGYWGEDIKTVIYYKNNYSVASLLDSCSQPPQECYEAVDYIITNGSILPKEVRYFRANYDHEWEGYKNYAIYDNIYFGYFLNNNH